MVIVGFKPCLKYCRYVAVKIIGRGRKILWLLIRKKDGNIINASKNYVYFIDT